MNCTVLLTIDTVQLSVSESLINKNTYLVYINLLGLLMQSKAHTGWLNQQKLQGSLSVCVLFKLIGIKLLSTQKSNH